VPDVAITAWPAAALRAISHAATSVARTIPMSMPTKPARFAPAAHRSAPIALAIDGRQTSFADLNPHSRLSSWTAASFNPA